MDEEIVDIVDENNKVLYALAKTYAHKKGLLHRTVIAEIKDNEGRWALVRQSFDRQDAGQYVSPVGGHVKSGETEEEAIKREAFEETGLKGFKFKKVGQVIFSREVLGRKENHYFILFEIFSDKSLRLNEESEDYVKFSDDELRDEIKNNPKKFGDAFFVILKEFYPYILS